MSASLEAKTDWIYLHPQFKFPHLHQNFYGLRPCPSNTLIFTHPNFSSSAALLKAKAAHQAKRSSVSHLLSFPTFSPSYPRTFFLIFQLPIFSTSFFSHLPNFSASHLIPASYAPYLCLLPDLTIFPIDYSTDHGQRTTDN